MPQPSLRKALRKAIEPKPSVPPKRYRLSPAQQLAPTGKRTQVSVPPRRRLTRLDPFAVSQGLIDVTGAGMGINPDAYSDADYMAARMFVAAAPIELRLFDAQKSVAVGYVVGVPYERHTVQAGSILEYDPINYQFEYNDEVVVTDVYGKQLVADWYDLKNKTTPIRSRAAIRPAPKVKRALSDGARRALAYALQNSDYALLYDPIDNTLWMSTHLALNDVHMNLANYPDITAENIGEAQMAVANAIDTGTTLQELIFTPILSDTQARAAMMAVQQPVKRDDPNPQAKIGQRVENLQAGYVASTDSDMETQLNREVQAGEMGTIIDVEVSPDYNLYIAMLDDGGYMSFSDYEVADGMVAWRSKKPVKRKAVKRAAPPPNVQSVLVQLHNGSSYVTFDWGNPYDLGAQVADMLVMNAEEAGNWIGANPDDYFDWAINMGWIDEDGNEL